MAETSAAEQGYHEYALWWMCGGRIGVYRHRTNDPDGLRADIEANASSYGLPFERVEVFKVARRVVIEPEPIRGRR